MSSINVKKLTLTIRYFIWFFIFALILSGITAFPIETELAIVNDHITLFPEFMREWLSQVYAAVKTTNTNYPFLGYGTDWLAFAHLIIAIAFIGPLRDPIKNSWVIQWGMVCCICVFPLAFIAGLVRGIPFYWQLIDCSFGVVGFILLFICYKKIKLLESMSL